jgi:GT2 family glycosyltransferase
MISIITAVYNQYEMNLFFIEAIEKYTRNKYELIIIDNGSTDGSQELFRQHGATVIQNDANYSYPHCQNQGIQIAQYDLFAFFNNDIMVSPNWDERLIHCMNKHKLEICGFGCNDSIEKTHKDTRPLKRKWKRVKNFFYQLFGSRYFALKLMIIFMFGNWEKWNKNWSEKYNNQIREGISGACVVFTRKALNIIGLWDEKVQDADFDIFIKVKKRNKEVGDIQTIYNIMEIYIHHFGRLTLKKKHPEFQNSNSIIGIVEKWGDQANELLKDINVKI